MSRFVLDCSVSMAWCLEDEADSYSDGVFLRLGTETAVVPALWVYETANVLLSAERQSRIEPAVATRFLEILRQLPIEIAGTAIADADAHYLALGRRQRLTAYDAAYLGLAVREGIALATRDRALRRAARNSGVDLLIVE